MCVFPICCIRNGVMCCRPRSRLCLSVASNKWRPQEDLSSLWEEQASITFRLSVSVAALCDAGLTPDLPRGQHQVEPRKDLSSWSAEQALIIFLLSVSGVVLCDAGLTPDLPCGQHQVEDAGGLAPFQQNSLLQHSYLLYQEQRCVMLASC